MVIHFEDIREYERNIECCGNCEYSAYHREKINDTNFVCNRELGNNDIMSPVSVCIFWKNDKYTKNERAETIIEDGKINHASNDND